MLRTVSVLAIAAASTQASALIDRGLTREQKTVCLSVSEGSEGELYGFRCDQSLNNQTQGREIKPNGCAEGQVAIIATRPRGSVNEDFQPFFPSCLPPNIAQL